MILGISSFHVLPAQTSEDDDILYWTKSQRLAFADFQGRPRREDTALQEASAKMLTHKLGSITKSIDVQYKTGPGKTVFTIQAGMKKGLSWIKNPGDTLSLKHEQGHFDICEIYTRMFRRDIQKAKSLAEAKELFDKATAAEEQEHDRYDRENTFQLGGITKEWSEKIRSRLAQLEAYNQPTVVIAIDK
jgi:hypothetical protein